MAQQGRRIAGSCCVQAGRNAHDIPVYDDLLDLAAVFCEGDDVNATDVTLMEGGLMGLAVLIHCRLQIGAMTVPVHKDMARVRNAHLRK